MWNVVSTYAFPARAELLSIIFMILALKFFMDSYKTEANRNAPYLVGMCFALMFFVSFNSIFILLGFLLFAFIEIFGDKESKLYEYFTACLLGFLAVCVFTSLFFIVNDGFKQFQSCFFVFNLDFASIPEWTKEYTHGLMKDIFLKKDLVLTILACFGLFTINLPKTLFRVLFFITSLTMLAYFIGFYPSYTFLFLPLLSVLVTSFILKFFIDRFFDLESSIKMKVVLAGLLVFLFGPVFGNLLQYQKTVYTQDIDNQRKQTEWVLENLDRNEAVALSRHACPAYVFNKDIRYFRKTGFRESKVAGYHLATDSLFNTIKDNNTKYFFIQGNEMEWTDPKLKEYLYENFEVKRIVEKYEDNCVWVRNGA